MIKLSAGTILSLALCLAAGALYNYVAVRRAQNQNPPPGEMYSIDGYRMHLYCTGSGTPTVVLDGGLGSTWISWQLVQPGLAKQTRVCSYDRAGLGWSDPRPGLRDSEAVVTQLHELLSAAGISGPLILVGQSAGGLYVRKYAANYPKDVAGLVLVDGTMPELFSRLPAERETDAQIAERHHQARDLRCQSGNRPRSIARAMPDQPD